MRDLLKHLLADLRSHDMLKQTEGHKRRAERIFKGREMRKADAPQAVKGYYAEIAKTVERMERLRAERLRRERKDT